MFGLGVGGQRDMAEVRRSEWDSRREVQINEQLSGGRIKGA